MADADPSYRTRLGNCCQQCLVPETEQRRFQCCGQCKQAHYCSIECQKKDWPHHKPTCQEHKPLMNQMKQLHGRDLVKSQNDWVEESRGGMLALAHALLGSRTRTHVLYVTNDYHPGSQPAFKVVEWTALPLPELQRRHATYHDTVVQHMQQTDLKISPTDWLGYAIVRCRNVQMIARIIPLGVDAEGIAALPPMGVEEIVVGINEGNWYIQV